eukprot:scaffold112718_cov75-Phaeocystis_antarctica.AAC.2
MVLDYDRMGNNVHSLDYDPPQLSAFGPPKNTRTGGARFPRQMSLFHKILSQSLPCLHSVKYTGVYTQLSSPRTSRRTIGSAPIGCSGRGGQSGLRRGVIAQQDGEPTSLLDLAAAKARFLRDYVSPLVSRFCCEHVR